MKDESQENKQLFRVAKFSRRQFLKRAGITVTGAALASILPASACKSSTDTTVPVTQFDPTTTAPVVNTSVSTTAPPSSSPVVSTTITTNPVSTSISPSTSTTSTPTTSVITTPTATGSVYVPPTALPVLIPVPGTSCTVATDRVYSKDHVWVKSLSDKIVVMGLSSTMVEILGEPYNISMLPAGTTIDAGGPFGAIEGYKMNADLITPVSGVITQTNSSVIAYMTNDPYNSGWILVIQLTKPEELKTLLTAQNYKTLAAS